MIPMSISSDRQQTTETIAARLAIVVNRLNARFREEDGAANRGITLSQVAMLHRLQDIGPLSVSSLAAEEHVTQQAITQRLALLDHTGYVESKPDPEDHRRKLVNITPEGIDFLKTSSVAEEGWLARAIDSAASDDDLTALTTSLDVLEHLAVTNENPGDPSR